jgi:uncharacterized delta-60 repeat protein
MSTKFIPANIFLVLVFMILNHFDTLSQPGQFDSSFNGNGRAFTGIPTDQYFANTSTLQPDGKLIVAGDSYTTFDHACMVRYEVNGTVDAGFGIAGKVKTDFAADVDRFYAVAVLRNGKIVAGGANGYSGLPQRGILARYQVDGSLDSTFGNFGKLLSDFGAGTLGSASVFMIAELPNGNLKITGSRRLANSQSSQIIAVVVKPNGALDSSVGTNGIIEITPDPRGLLVGNQQNGTMIFALNQSMGGTNHVRLSRYFANGELDSSFNIKGSATYAIGKLGGYIHGGMVLHDDKILLYGHVMRFSSIYNNNNAVDLGLLKFTSSGSPDSSFGDNGITTATFKEFYQPADVLLQADGKILVAGTTDDGPQLEDVYTLARFLDNGRLDSTFADQGKKIFNIPGMEGTCRRMHLRNHRIYLTGWSNYQNVSTFAVFAIQNDGIPLSPVVNNLCTASPNASFTADIGGTAFQWQLQKDSSGFANINNDSVHNGVNGATVLLQNIPASFHGYQYRCITNKGTSNIFTLQFSNLWTGAKTDHWEDARNWSCATVPDSTTNVVVDFGPVVISVPVSIHSLTIKEGVNLTITSGASLVILGPPGGK